MPQSSCLGHGGVTGYCCIRDKKGPASSSTDVDYYFVGGRPRQRSGQHVVWWLEAVTIGHVLGGWVGG